MKRSSVANSRTRSARVGLSSSTMRTVAMAGVHPSYHIGNLPCDVTGGEVRRAHLAQGGPNREALGRLVQHLAARVGRAPARGVERARHVTVEDDAQASS